MTRPTHLRLVREDETAPELDPMNGPMDGGGLLRRVFATMNPNTARAVWCRCGTWMGTLDRCPECLEPRRAQ